MKKTENENLKEMALMEQEKVLNEAGIEIKGKVIYPQYWAKRKHRLNKELVKLLQESANREPEVKDGYGEYKPGTFLHRAFVVTVGYENGLWSIHIIGDAPITGAIIKEVRYKYVPDYCLMLQFYPSREESKATKGIILYEMPGSTQKDGEPEKEAEE